MRIKLQQDIKDCGLVILQAFYKKIYNKWISINEFKKEAFYNESGISFANLELIANKFGMNLNIFSGDFNALAQLKLDQPIIILINDNGSNHYVILQNINLKGDFEIIDPMTGNKLISKESMAQMFLNSIGVIEKQKEHKALKPKSNFKQILSYLISPLSIGIVITSLLGSILLIMSSFYMKIIFDKVIKNESYSLLAYIFGIFCLLLLFKLWNDFHKAYFLKKLNLQIEQQLISRYAFGLTKIDLHYLTKISSNDNLRRINLIASVADFIANFIFSIISELIIFIFAFTMLLMINLQLFWIVSVGSLTLIIFSYFYQKFITKNYQKIVANNLATFGSQMNLVQNAVKLKQNSTQKFYLNNFFDKHHEKKKLEFKLFKWNLLNNFVFGLISQFIPLLIIFVGIILYFQKQTSFGNVLVFIAFFGFYLTPLKSFTEIILKLPIFKNDYEHLNFILEAKQEMLNDNLVSLAKINNIEFENYSFSFDNYKKIFQIKHLKIDQSIKIIGKNGCGKSTFLKSIALENYASGNYLINGIDKNQFAWKQIRSKILYINTNDFVANCSLFSFITEEDEQKIKQFMELYTKLNLESVFVSLNLSLVQLLENNGLGLSSGQRQFIFLMKIFTQKFDLIMLDEAFENIDNQTIKLLGSKILEFQHNTIFIEISHNNKFISTGKEINFETL